MSLPAGHPAALHEHDGAARDTASVATRMTSSRLIGRDVELAELEAALGDAADGRPSLTFVAGESGVGKSRLLAELTARALETGARVEMGDCVELGTEELPYAPIVAVLRSLAREGDAVLAELPPPCARSSRRCSRSSASPPSRRRPQAIRAPARTRARRPRRASSRRC